MCSGEHKSAVEPLIRDDMSEPAREAARALMEGLWAEYRDRIATNRALPAEALDGLIDDMPDRLRAVDGDFARLALETGLVDELLTRDAYRARLREAIGADDDDGFLSIGLRDYVGVARAGDRIARMEATRKVAVVVAEGTITGGSEAETVGELTATMIRNARRDDDVAAVAAGEFAGWQCLLLRGRNELELAQLQGKPVAALGGIAASGGYWISATADRIFAEPDTITGSIGIFGILATSRTVQQCSASTATALAPTAFPGPATCWNRSIRRSRICSSSQSNGAMNVSSTLSLAVAT